MAFPKKALSPYSAAFWYMIATTEYPKTKATNAFVRSTRCSMLMAGVNSKALSTISLSLFGRSFEVLVARGREIGPTRSMAIAIQMRMNLFGSSTYIEPIQSVTGMSARTHCASMEPRIWNVSSQYRAGRR